MIKVARFLAATALVVAASSAQAAIVIVNFDSLTVGNQAGTVSGLVFNNFQVSNGFGPSSPPNFAFNNQAIAGFDFGAGFTSLSFAAGAFTNSLVSVFSGVGGSGTLLGSVTVTNPPADPNAFSPWSVSFAGVGRSVVVSTQAATFGWDDVTINTGGAVPEPASWAMLIAGFGLVGAASRRRRAAIA